MRSGGRLCAAIRSGLSFAALTGRERWLRRRREHGNSCASPSRVAPASFLALPAFTRRFLLGWFVINAVSTRMEGTSGERSTTKVPLFFHIYPRDASASILLSKRSSTGRGVNQTAGPRSRRPGERSSSTAASVLSFCRPAIPHRREIRAVFVDRPANAQPGVGSATPGQHPDDELAGNRRRRIIGVDRHEQICLGDALR